MIDTGASCSLMDIGTFEKLGLNTEIEQNTHYSLTDASGNAMNIIGTVNISVSLNPNLVVNQNVKILNARTYKHVLLGRDFLSHFRNIEFDFLHHNIRIGRTWFNCVKPKAEEPVRLGSKTRLEPRSEKVITVHCNKSMSLITADFEPATIKGVSGVYATPCRIIPNVAGVFQVTLLNVSNNPVELNSRKHIGKLVTSNKTICTIDSVGSEQSSITTANVTHGDLSADEKTSLLSLISKYNNIFAENPKKPTLVKNVEHRIITEDAQPVSRKSHRIPYAWNDEINKQIQQMLENDIIRPSSSPWNAPVILVKKKDNTMRFVCDFRGLNDVTKKDTYPLPHISDVIDKMQGAKYWTTLDAASAYWSMPLAEADKEKTAFSVQRGKFEFNVTPYGLCNAGASYQRMIDINLAGLPSDRILAYMDDIVIFSKTFSEHLTSLEHVFQRLILSGVSLKLSKCVFASRTVDFLGFELSHSGIKPQSRLTDAVLNFGRPKTRKELKGFLGLAGFYRAFVPKFAQLSQPLNHLTSDKVPFVWSDACETAFNSLKQQLASKPVSCFPQLDQPFIVEVDASNHAVGGVLSQYGDDGKPHPVAYYSTALQQSQKNWSATSKEAFALMMAVRHWRVYLAGTQFVLNSDHNPLTHLRSQKDPRGKFGRWISELEEFDYSIQYIPGKNNVKADALSRNTAACNIQPSSEFDGHIYATFVDNDHFIDQLKEEQSKDPCIRSAKDAVRTGTKIVGGRLKRVQRQLRVADGILTKSGRPILPLSLRKTIVSEYHNLGHFGTDKVYALLKERFYWPNMYQYVKTFGAGCQTCQKSKCDTSPPKAPLQRMFVPNAPMQLVSLDIAYLPKDSNGYQYILLIGDTFSKFIQAIPLKDQTAPTIVNAFLQHWIYLHGTPSYLLTDQGSNVDGNCMKEICNKLGIEKRRSSAYHSQGNGFAERHIRAVKDVLRSILLHRGLSQSTWCKILPEVVFALNTSLSKATQCVPYNIVFGRSAILPQDIVFESLHQHRDQFDQRFPKEYEEETSSLLREIYSQVITTLALSKEKMQQHYNKNIRYIDYAIGQKVWLKVKHYKTGENRKLAPRRDGPWTIVEKLPNGVNFCIENSHKERKIVHHDRLVPVVQNELSTMPLKKVQKTTEPSSEASDQSSISDYSPSESESDSDNNDEAEIGYNLNPRERLRPRRQTQPRRLADTIPWSALKL